MTIFREKIRNAISPRYSAVVHVAVPAVVGIGLIVFALLQLHAVKWWEFLFPPVIYVLSNAVEHRAHRLALHKRTPGMTDPLRPPHAHPPPHLRREGHGHPR